MSDEKTKYDIARFEFAPRAMNFSVVLGPELKFSSYSRAQYPGIYLDLRNIKHALAVFEYTDLRMSKSEVGVKFELGIIESLTLFRTFSII